LVAEMTGAFVCAALSIEPTVRHADYLGSWLEVLREDNRAIIRAASAASKAADYLLAFRDAALIPDTENDRTLPPAPQAATSLAAQP
jgi:antirestriction protein ArdC